MPKPTQGCSAGEEEEEEEEEGLQIEVLVDIQIYFICCIINIYYNGTGV